LVEALGWLTGAKGSSSAEGVLIVDPRLGLGFVLGTEATPEIGSLLRLPLIEGTGGDAIATSKGDSILVEVSLTWLNGVEGSDSGGAAFASALSRPDREDL
jgi:hypothetical protein